MYVVLHPRDAPEEAVISHHAGRLDFFFLDSVTSSSRVTFSKFQFVPHTSLSAGHTLIYWARQQAFLTCLFWTRHRVTWVYSSKKSRRLSGQSWVCKRSQICYKFLQKSVRDTNLGGGVDGWMAGWTVRTVSGSMAGRMTESQDKPIAGSSRFTVWYTLQRGRRGSCLNSIVSTNTVCAVVRVYKENKTIQGTAYGTIYNGYLRSQMQRKCKISVHTLKT